MLEKGCTRNQYFMHTLKICHYIAALVLIHFHTYYHTDIAVKPYSILKPSQIINKYNTFLIQC